MRDLTDGELLMLSEKEIQFLKSQLDAANAKLKVSETNFWKTADKLQSARVVIDWYEASVCGGCENQLDGTCYDGGAKARQWLKENE